MILRHAAVGFRRDGYDDATVAWIAQESGVSEGAVFKHFGSKTGLLAAVMDQFYAEVDATALDIATGPDNLERRFRRFVDAFALRVERDWDLIRIFIQRARYGTDSEINSRWTQNNRRYTRLFLALVSELQKQRLLDNNVPPSLIRDIVFGSIEYVALGQECSPLVGVRQRAGEVIDVLLRDHTAAMPLEEGLQRIEDKLDASVPIGYGSATVWLLDGPATVAQSNLPTRQPTAGSDR